MGGPTGPKAGMGAAFCSFKRCSNREMAFGVDGSAGLSALAPCQATRSMRNKLVTVSPNTQPKYAGTASNDFPSKSVRRFMVALIVLFESLRGDSIQRTSRLIRASIEFSGPCVFLQDCTAIDRLILSRADVTYVAADDLIAL